MPSAYLIKAWLTLVALSVGTVVLTMPGVSGTLLVAGGVLLLAGIKAHVILTRYLGLVRSRFWTHAFDFAIAAFLLLSFSLYAFGSGV
jgi:nitric oxide reductase NorF protein